MQEPLIQLAEGCLEIHQTAADRRDALVGFRRNIQEAYRLGFVDAEKKYVTEKLAREGAVAVPGADAVKPIPEGAVVRPAEPAAVTPPVTKAEPAKKPDPAAAKKAIASF
jgi:hypothetical protein